MYRSWYSLGSQKYMAHLHGSLERYMKTPDLEFPGLEGKI